jgi:hypothetical protein
LEILKLIIAKIFGVVILSIIAGVAYRMGGSGKYPRYVRELAASIALIISMLILGYFHWSIILCAGALYGLETTYFKKKGKDATWFNWLLVGLAFSIAVLPIVLVYHNWIGFSVRSVICTFLVVYWSETNGNVVWEECGRGIIPIATLPLLLIGS